MSLSVNEDRLAAVNQLGENTLQTVLQGKMELPNAAAPIERVVWVKGKPVLQSVTADQDRVYVRGAVDLALVYAPETLEGDPAGLRRVEWSGALPFDIYVDVVGAEPEMTAEAEAKVLICEWEARGGQHALDLDLIIATTVRVYQKKEFTIISGANLARPVKLVMDGLTLIPCTPEVQVGVDKEITGILEIPEEYPAIGTVLDLVCQAKIGEKEISPGRAGLAGSVGFDLIYEAKEDFSVQQLSFDGELPLEINVENELILPEMVLKERLILDCQGYPVNEGVALRVELGVKGTLDFQERSPVRVLTELTAPGDQVQTRKELLATDSFVNEKEQEGSVQGLVEIGQRFPPVRDVLRCEAIPHLTDYQIDEDKIVLEGIFDLELFYLAYTEEDSRPLYKGVFPEAIPFQQTLVLAGLEPGMQPRITVQTLQVRPDLINRETVEIALTFRAAATVWEYLEVEAVVEAVEVEAPPAEPPSLTYVFVQKGDTVWKLARQYHSSEEAILRANPALEDGSRALSPGDKIYIPRH